MTDLPSAEPIPAAPGRLRQSFAWWSFHNRTPLAPGDLLRAAAQIGYRGVDLLDEAHWGLARDAGLTIVCAGGHQSLADGLNRRANHDRIEREITANLEKAVRWNIPNLVVFSGNRDDGVSDDVGADNTAEILARVAPLAESANATLILELLNSRRDHLGYQADRTAWGAAVCARVNSPRVKLLFDIYHVQLMEGDIIARIRENIAFIAHVHTAGVPGRHDLDGAMQELAYPAIVCALRETGYSGFVAHEFIPEGDAVTALENAFYLCNV